MIGRELLLETFPQFECSDEQFICEDDADEGVVSFIDAVELSCLSPASKLTNILPTFQNYEIYRGGGGESAPPLLFQKVVV